MRFITIAFIILLSTTQSISQKLHAFLFCKTNDPEIRVSVSLNFSRFNDQTILIAEALGIERIPHICTGLDFKASKVSSIIANSNIDSNDIVIMYFSTHGEISIYDEIIFPQLDIPNEMVSAYNKHKQLVAHRPKFILTIIEACSGYTRILPQKAFLIEQSPTLTSDSLLTPLQISNIKTLFSSQCNTIITAGEPGKNTWASTSGSFFTNSLLLAMNEVINTAADKKSNVTWDKLLKKAQIYTYEKTRGTTVRYHPVWETDNCTGDFIQQVSLAMPDTSLTSSTLHPSTLLQPNLSEVALSEQGFSFNNSKKNISPDKTNNTYPNLNSNIDSAKLAGRVVNRSIADFDSTNPKMAVLKIETEKINRSKYWRVNLAVIATNDTANPIEKVVYFLHYTMPRPKVEITYSDNDFLYSFKVWGGYEIKVKVFFSDGTIEDIYGEIILDKKDKIETLSPINNF